MGRWFEQTEYEQPCEPYEPYEQNYEAYEQFDYPTGQAHDHQEAFKYPSETQKYDQSAFNHFEGGTEDVVFEDIYAIPPTKEKGSDAEVEEIDFGGDGDVEGWL